MQFFRGIPALALLGALLSAVASGRLCWAAPPAARPIPTRPSAPPALTVKGPSDAFQCQRYFTYKGQTIGCDSNIRLDGEKLRPIIKDIPEAVAELDLYQQNRLKIRTAAYTGTFGLGFFLIGLLLSGNHKAPDGKLDDTGRTLLNLALIGGGGITGGSFLYALSFIRTNEAHLANAVTLHNQARPDSPIELQFSTGISF
ncbi:MAG: hypothetical protein NDJ89_16305 [Oligoflexia bacterium]|nr:hypothetical protein [Oligoflexia bacterium]